MRSTDILLAAFLAVVAAQAPAAAVPAVAPAATPATTTTPAAVPAAAAAAAVPAPATPATPATPAAGAGAGSAVPAGVSAAKTDVGSILKSMDQTKLASIPANARAVMKKMPETPTDVTMEDRSAIKGCITLESVDKLGKLAVSSDRPSTRRAE